MTNINELDMKKDFPSNTHKSKIEENEEPRKVEKVIKGNVVKRKKSFGKRLVETFVGEDINNVTSYIIHDVLIPAAKDMLYDLVKGSLEMTLFPGEKRSSRTKRDGGRSYVSYEKCSSGRRDDRRDRYDSSSKNRVKHNFDDIILESRGEAEEVLSNLVDLTIDYGQATIADLYGFVGIPENYTDRKYGWEDLSNASVSRVRDGYLINLPKAILLD